MTSTFVRGLLVLLASTALALPIRSAGSELTDSVKEILDTDAASDTDELARGLAAIGPAVLPVLFDALVLGHVGGRALGSLEQDAVLKALARLPRSEVQRFLRDLAATRPDQATQATALLVLREVGMRGDVLSIARLVRPADGERVVSRGLRLGAEGALAAILARDPAARLEVRDALRSAHPSLVAPFARAVGRDGSPESLRILAAELGRGTDADLVLLVEIARIARSVPHPVDLHVREAVREHLFDAAPRALAAAVVAAGALEDPDSVPRLIELVGAPGGLGTEAVRALRSITGLALGTDPSVWEAWYLELRSWRERRAAAELRSLGSAEPSIVSRLLLDLAGRRVYRHEIAAAICPVLERPEADLVHMACAALGHLGSRVAVPALVDCLERKDPRFQASVLAALQKITGLDLGPDAEAWRELEP